MNYLAHMYFAGDDKEIIFGNFIADFVKGNKYNEYSQGIARGILMHRKLDELIDTHPLAGEVRKIYFREYRHYAGIIIDMIFDHFLASNWDKFHVQSLKDFSEEKYEKLDKLKHQMPEQARQVYLAMTKQDWLSHYVSKEGVHEALTRMSKRHGFKKDLGRSVSIFNENQTFIEMKLANFYDEAINIAADWLK